MCHQHMVHEKSFVSSLTACSARQGPLDMQSFTSVLQREAELAAKESWLLHDLQLVRRVAELLPPGSATSAMAGVDSMTACERRSLTDRIAEQINAVLQEGSGAAAAMPSPEQSSMDAYVEMWQSKVQLMVNEAERRLKKMAKIQIQMQEVEAENEASKELEDAEQRLQNAEPGSAEATPAALALCQLHGILSDDDVNKTNALGETPLVTACADGFADHVILLLQAGAHVRVSNTHGQSPLFESAFLGHVDIVKALVQFNADVDERDSKSGMTALLCASMEVNLACVRHTCVFTCLRTHSCFLCS